MTPRCGASPGAPTPCCRSGSAPCSTTGQRWPAHWLRGPPGCARRWRSSPVEQMTLRIYGEAATTLDESAVDDGGAGQRYLARRLHARRAPEVDPLRRALRGLVSAERIERHERPPLLASVYHLVRRGDSERYLATVAAASARLNGVRVSPSGPWPAYAFAPDAVA